MDRRSQGSPCADEKKCTDVALPVVVFAHRRYPGNRVLAEYRNLDILLLAVHYQLRVVVRTYRQIQVAALADLAQKTLKKFKL
jgi:hypothetical protein